MAVGRIFSVLRGGWNGAGLPAGPRRRLLRVLTGTGGGLAAGGDPGRAPVPGCFFRSEERGCCGGGTGAMDGRS